MRQEEWGKNIEYLLSQPLSSRHIAYLQSLTAKVRQGFDFDQEPTLLFLCSEYGLPIPPGKAVRKSSRNDATPERTRTLEIELEKARELIAKLSERGKRAVAQRDQWEARAMALEARLAELSRQSGQHDHKFERVKRVFAKLYHPNAASARSPLETVIRGEVFKEFWAELERIEAES